MYKIKESEEEQFWALRATVRKKIPKNAQCLIEKEWLFLSIFHLHDEALHCLEEALKYDAICDSIFLWLACLLLFWFFGNTQKLEKLYKSIN